MDASHDRALNAWGMLHRAEIEFCRAWKRLTMAERQAWLNNHGLEQCYYPDSDPAYMFRELGA